MRKRKHNPQEEERKAWSSEPAFVASMTAAAVGLGNLWRFPYIVGQHGGGAFVIAYLLALFIVVFPIMLLEVAAGRLAQGSTIATYRQVNRFGTYYGWFVVAITIAITSYYLVITGWTLGYTVDALRDNLRSFDSFRDGYNSLWYFLVVTALATVILIVGLRAIETLSKILMPLLLAVIVFIIFYASRTPGWEEAKTFFFQVDWGRLTDTSLWGFAFGQAFYTLAIGQGYLVTYGSYIPRKTHLPRACMIVAVTELCIALMAGWMIFPFVFGYGHSPDEGSQLAFVTLPQVFGEMRGGLWVGIMFFTLFFAAAFSSSLAGLKVIVAAVSEELKLPNRYAVLAVSVLMLLLGTASALSFTPLDWRIAGEPVLDFIDRVAGGNVIIISGILGAAFFCWLVPAKRIRDVLGTPHPWWHWRIYIVGRFLPVVVIVWLIVTRFLQTFV